MDKTPPPALLLLVVPGRDDDVVVLNLAAENPAPKNASRRELLAAIEVLLRAERYMSGSAAVSPLRVLSPRETQVLKRIAEGARNRDIAAELALSVKTIEKHRSSLMRKLNLRNTAALTAFAIENRLAGTTSAATA